MWLRTSTLVIAFLSTQTAKLGCELCFERAHSCLDIYYWICFQIHGAIESGGLSGQSEISLNIYR